MSETIKSPYDLKLTVPPTDEVLAKVYELLKGYSRIMIITDQSTPTEMYLPFLSVRGFTEEDVDKIFGKTLKAPKKK